MKHNNQVPISSDVNTINFGSFARNDYNGYSNRHTVYAPAATEQKDIVAKRFLPKPVTRIQSLTALDGRG